jgi:hypothetical protein
MSACEVSLNRSSGLLLEVQLKTRACRRAPSEGETLTLDDDTVDGSERCAHLLRREQVFLESIAEGGRRRERRKETSFAFLLHYSSLWLI